MSGPQVQVVGFDDLDPRTAYALWRLRQEVFVVEQACPYPDLDGRDLEPTTRHVSLVEDDAPIGYLRVLDDGDHLRIGRVVLAPAARGRGLADLLMSAALAACDLREVWLDAQVGADRLYARHGFAASGAPFLEDGIPHVPMIRPAGMSSVDQPGRE